MFAYCNNNPVNYSDPTGLCGNPTCVSCNPERADFVKNRESWIKKVNPDFEPYSCKPMYNSFTTRTVQGVYADYKRTEHRTVFEAIPNYGYASLTIIFDTYEDKNGVSYIAMRGLEYSVNNVYNLDYVMVNYGNSFNTQQHISHDSNGTYSISWEPTIPTVLIGGDYCIY